MPLPSFQKTWTIAPNNRYSPFVSLNDCMASVLFSAKNFLVATMGYTVVYTSDGTTGPASGADHTDRWLSKSNCTTRFNGTAGAQSFAVLQDGNGAQLLLSYNGATDDIATIRYSASGLYTPAGTPTFEPTATDEIIIATGISLINATASGDRVWHMWCSSDKKMFRWVLLKSSAIQFITGLEQITSAVLPPAALPNGVHAFFHTDPNFANNSGAPHYSASGVFQTSSYRGGMARVHSNGTDQSISLVGFFPSFGGTNMSSYPFTNEKPYLQGQSGELLYLLQKASTTSPNSTADGVLGTCIDWWITFSGSSTGANIGDFMGALQFVVIGTATVWPWDQATTQFQIQ